MIRNTIFLFSFFLAFHLYAQNGTGGKLIREEHIRSSDVMWKKRIWRRIDFRQKQNHHFVYAGDESGHMKPFVEYLFRAVDEGSILAYHAGLTGDDLSFAVELTPAEIDQIVHMKDTVTTEKLDGSGDTTVVVLRDLGVEDIVMIELVEDWIFDKERSVMEVRIVAIAPIQLVFDEISGEYRGVRKLFWIDFTEVRNEMNKWPAFNRWNDASTLSFYDVMQKRMFSGFIVKESNVYGRYLHAYLSPKEALIEGQEIESQLFVMEHDLWSR